MPRLDSSTDLVDLVETRVFVLSGVVWPITFMLLMTGSSLTSALLVIGDGESWGGWFRVSKDEDACDRHCYHYPRYLFP